MSNLQALELSYARGALKDAVGTLEDRARTAMQAARHGTGLTMLSEDERFSIAVAALASTYPEESKERGRIQQEVAMLQGLNAAMAGVPVDFGRLTDQAEERQFEPIGLVKIWREVIAE